MGAPLTLLITRLFARGTFGLNVQATYGEYYATNIHGQKSVDVIEAHNPANGPLFLYAAFTAPHSPLQALDTDFADCSSAVGWLRVNTLLGIDGGSAPMIAWEICAIPGLQGIRRRHHLSQRSTARSIEHDFPLAVRVGAKIPFRLEAQFSCFSMKVEEYVFSTLSCHVLYTSMGSFILRVLWRDSSPTTVVVVSPRVANGHRLLCRIFLK